jgi:putative transcriptional regulator
MSARIEVRLDVMLAKRQMTSKALAERIGVSEVALSQIKTGKIKGMRFSTLLALCEVLDCEPGDLLVLARDED